MTKEQLLEIDEAANNFARSKKYDLARYVGEFKGKRIFLNTIHNVRHMVVYHNSFIPILD